MTKKACECNSLRFCSFLNECYTCCFYWAECFWNENLRVFWLYFWKINTFKLVNQFVRPVEQNYDICENFQRVFSRVAVACKDDLGKKYWNKLVKGNLECSFSQLNTHYEGHKLAFVNMTSVSELVPIEFEPGQAKASAVFVTFTTHWCVCMRARPCVYAQELGLCLFIGNK